MEFYLVDVKSTVSVNGADVAFDYINTYLTLNEALRVARDICGNDDVLECTVHKWILNEDGTHEHAEDSENGLYFMFLNHDHREWR